MKLEDYSKYYIQGSDHYLIPKDIFVELFNEMLNWKQESEELKKELDKTSDELYTLKNKYNIRLLNQISENIKPDCEDYYLAEIETKANKYDLIQSQQQEFIKYMRELSNWYSADGARQGLVNGILQKYKSIIGNDINVGTKGGNKDEK